MSTWIATQAGDFINLDHVVALEAMETEAKDPEHEEHWFTWAVLSDNREVRLPGTFTTEANAQAWLRDLLNRAKLPIINLET